MIINQKIPIHFSDGIELYLKREDQNHPIISGNKYRKLFYNIQEAKKLGKKGLLTFGGAFSNHIHATAGAGLAYGFKTIGIIRGDELDNKVSENPTLLDAQMMIPFTVMTTVFPRLSRLHHEQSQDYRAYFKRHVILMTTAGTFFFLATYFGAPYFIPLIYSGDFVASVKILQLLSLMLIFVFMNVLFSQTLVSIHKERVFTGVMLFNAVLSIAGNSFLVPVYGITSAAVVRVSLEAFSSIVMGGFIFYHVFYRRENVPLQ